MRVGRASDRSRIRSVLISSCLLAFLASGQLEAAPLLTTNSSRTTGAWGGYSANSWALGLVVPEGAQLAGGGKVHWEDVSNVTALVRLPNINRTDGIIYVVLSVMTNGSSVLQVAVGIYPNNSRWLVYSDFVTNVLSIPPAYQWVLNSSEPSISPEATVSISVFRSSATGWSLRVLDTNTSLSVERAFPVSAAVPPKVGDQEVLALESFSRTGSVFENMGNLTMESLLIDGREVSGGCYTYNGWTTGHNPLFAVGGYSPSLPGFIALGQGRDDTFVWSYWGGWVGDGGQNLFPWGSVALLSVLLASLGAVYLVFRLLTNARSPDGGGTRREGHGISATAILEVSTGCSGPPSRALA